MKDIVPDKFNFYEEVKELQQDPGRFPLDTDSDSDGELDGDSDGDSDGELVRAFEPIVRLVDAMFELGQGHNNIVNVVDIAEPKEDEAEVGEEQPEIQAEEQAAQQIPANVQAQQMPANLQAQLTQADERFQEILGVLDDIIKQLDSIQNVYAVDE